MIINKIYFNRDDSKRKSFHVFISLLLKIYRKSELIENKKTDSIVNNR